jgi:hypothetical protein
MADEVKLKPKGSCLGKLVALVALAGVAGLGAAVFFMAQPQDLSDIKGSAGTTKSPDLRAVLQSAVDRGDYEVTLTEEDINLYLKQTLLAKQGGLLEKAVAFDGVRVRLEEGRAEIIMERSVMGQPITLSMFVRVEQTLSMKGTTQTTVMRDGGPMIPQLPRTERLVKGGRFGQLVVPQGFLLLVLPAYQKLAAAYQKELELGFEEMSRITMSDGKLVLDPRPDGGAELPGPSGSF